MEGRLGLSKSHRRSAVFNSRATTTPGTTVSSSKNELLELVAPWVEDLYDSDKISGDTEEKEFGQFIFTTLRETVFSDPSNSDSLEWLGEELEEDDKCEMAELWRENFTFDNSSEPLILDLTEEKQGRECQLVSHSDKHWTVSIQLHRQLCFHMSLTRLYPLFGEYVQYSFCANTHDGGSLLSGRGFGAENELNHDILFIDRNPEMYSLRLGLIY